MKVTQADYKFYENTSNAKQFIERIKAEKEEYGELRIELECFPIYYNYALPLFKDVKIDFLLLPKRPSLRDVYCFTKGRISDLIHTLEIPRGVKRVYENAFWGDKYRQFDIWKLQRLILPSNGLTDINDLSFVGVMPKEIYLRDKEGNLITENRRFKIIQGQESGRADGCAVLIDLKTSKQLIPANTDLREYKILERWLPEFAIEWRKMDYKNFLEFTSVCEQFGIVPNPGDKRHEEYHTSRTCLPYVTAVKRVDYFNRDVGSTLLDFKKAMFFPERSSDIPIEKEFWFLKKEVGYSDIRDSKEKLGILARNSKLLSDLIIACKMEELYLDKWFDINKRYNMLGDRDILKNEEVAEKVFYGGGPDYTKEYRIFDMETMGKIYEPVNEWVWYSNYNVLKSYAEKIKVFCFSKDIFVDTKIIVYKVDSNSMNNCSPLEIGAILCKLQIPGVATLEYAAYLDTFEMDLKQIETIVKEVLV